MSKKLCKHGECIADLKFLMIFIEAFFNIFYDTRCHTHTKKKDNKQLRIFRLRIF